MALHNLALNLGILSGSFLGPILANIVGLKEALFLAGLLRLLAGLVFIRWG
jgi:predicted MFS family arabinose efflux permease